MEILFEEFDAGKSHHLGAAELVARWSGGAGTMLPLTVEKITAFSHSRLAFTADGATALGHIAVTSPPGARDLVIGGHVVNPDFRGRKIGHQLLQDIVEQLPEKFPNLRTCWAHVNSVSLPIYLDVGADYGGRRPLPSQTGCDYVADLMPLLLPKLHDTAALTGYNGKHED